MLLKACPKCRGDVAYNEDKYGTFWTCLQCGYLKDETPPGEPKPMETRIACEAGHPYVEGNESIDSRGFRRCLVCAREHNHEYYRRHHPNPRPIGRPRKQA